MGKFVFQRGVIYKFISESPVGVEMLLWILFAAHAADPPFWKAKQKYAIKVRDGEVVVSVSLHGAGADRALTIVGGGRVKAPPAFTFNFARRLDCVAKSSSFVKRAELAGDQLRVTFAALGRTADFSLRVRADEAARRLDFNVSGGPLDQLRASLSFAAPAEVQDNSQTEVGIDGRYAYRTGLGGAVLGLGLEGVFRLLAEHLRRAAEAEFAHPGGQAAKGCGKLAP